MARSNWHKHLVCWTGPVPSRTDSRSTTIVINKIRLLHRLLDVVGFSELPSGSCRGRRTCFRQHFSSGQSKEQSHGHCVVGRHQCQQRIETAAPLQILASSVVLFDDYVLQHWARSFRVIRPSHRPDSILSAPGVMMSVWARVRVGSSGPMLSLPRVRKRLTPH